MLLEAQIIFIAEHCAKVQASWETFVRLNGLLFNWCRKMHPFGLIHDMNCIETFFLKKRKTSKGQSDISALSNIQQGCSLSKIPSPMSWMGLEQGKDKPQLETRFRTKSRAIPITWARRAPSCLTAAPLPPQCVKHTALHRAP